MGLLTRWGVLVEEEGSTYVADNDGDSDQARTLRPLQAAPGQWPGPSSAANSPLECLCPGSAYRIAFGPRAGQKVLTGQGAMPWDRDFASSDKSVGEFWLRQPAEHVMQGEFCYPEGPVAVRFSHSDFGFGRLSPVDAQHPGPTRSAVLGCAALAVLPAPAAPGTAPRVARFVRAFENAVRGSWCKCRMHTLPGRCRHALGQAGEGLKHQGRVSDAVASGYGCC